MLCHNGLVVQRRTNEEKHVSISYLEEQQQFHLKLEGLRNLLWEC